MSQPQVTLIRRVAFSSGHRYWLPDLNASQNKELFGQWASPYNHGHNYYLWVGCTGPIDPHHGMVVNIKWIDDVLQEKVVKQFDQKSINDEVPFFRDKAPTVENLLAYFAGELQNMPGGVATTSLKLEETPLLYGEWHPHQMITVTRVYEFAAAHRLDVPEMSHEENLRLFGKCNNRAGHGHNYILEVTVEGTPDATTGMICDIGALDKVVNEQVVDRYDHKNFNCDMPEFAGINPTSEVVVLEIYNRLKGVTPAVLSRVRLFETARNVFEVSKEA